MCNIINFPTKSRKFLLSQQFFTHIERKYVDTISTPQPTEKRLQSSRANSITTTIKEATTKHILLHNQQFFGYLRSNLIEKGHGQHFFLRLATKILHIHPTTLLCFDIQNKSISEDRGQTSGGGSFADKCIMQSEKRSEMTFAVVRNGFSVLLPTQSLVLRPNNDNNNSKLTNVYSRVNRNCGHLLPYP